MTSEDLAPGTVFHGLEIVEVLGRGGMGVVYKARQPELDRFVALKVLPGRLALDPEFVQRFRREAKALAALSHPNIVSIFDFGTEDGRCFFVMEHVDGVNLRRAMSEGLRIPDDALAIVRQVCDALEYAHGEGVIHRDIKPENILVDRKGRVKIADFGLAKMTDDPGFATQSNLVMGTPPYMAPEQYQQPKGVDHRADVYALGVVFYEMMTGAHPSEPFVPPSRRTPIDGRCDGVIEKALRRSRDERYQHAADLRTDLETVLVGPPAKKPGRWKPAVASLCVFAVAAVLVVVAAKRREAISPAAPELGRPAPDPFRRLGSEDAIFLPGVEPPDVRVTLPRRFTIRFGLRYEIAPSQEPWLILSFGEAQAIWLFPESDHVAAHMTNDGGGWAMREKQPMPKGRPAPGEWCEVEVRWDGSHARLRVDGETGFEREIGPPGREMHFLVRGAWKEVRIRDVRLHDDDQP